MLDVSRLRYAILAVLFCLAQLRSSSALAGVATAVEKRVNPGDINGAYAGFAGSSFAVDSDLNAGSLADTWVSYALNLVPTDGMQVSFLDINITSPLSPTTGFLQRYMYNE